MSRAGTRCLLRLAVACAVVAAGADGSAELGIETYTDPRPVVSGDKLFLFVRATGAAGTSCLCLRDDGENGWSRLSEFHADFTCVAADDKRFYLFVKDMVVAQEAAGDSCRQTGEARWPYNWPVRSADVRDGRLTVFGVGGRGRLYTASVPLVAPVEPSPAPAEPAAESSRPARVAGSRYPNFLRADWEPEKQLTTTGQEPCQDVATAFVAETLWVFWSTAGEGDRTVIRAAPLGPGGLGEAVELAACHGPMGFAAAAFGGAPVVIYAPVRVRLSEQHPLQYRSLEGETWRPFRIAGAVTNPHLEQTFTLRAASHGEAIHLFLGTRVRVLRSVYDGEGWTPPARVLANPVFDWVFEHLGLVVSAGVAAALVLVASMIRARFLPRRAVIADVEYRLASWLQRGGAYACDLCLTLAVVRVAQVALGSEGSQSALMLGVFCFELFYFSMLEARSGRTLGKRLFRIMVVSRNGGYPSRSEALIRNAVRAFADSLFVGFGWLIGSIFILNTRGSQRVGDLGAGTYVVRDKSTR